MKKFENIKIDFDDEFKVCRWFFTYGEKKYARGFGVKEITSDKQIQVIEDMLTCMKRAISQKK